MRGRRHVVLTALVACVAVGVQGAQAAHAQPSGASAATVVLSGPRTDLRALVAYRYTVAISPRWTHRQARLTITAPAAHYLLTRLVNLRAHRPLTVRFTLRYPSSKPSRITVALSLPGGHGSGGRRVLTRAYPVAFSGMGESAPPASSGSGSAVAPARPPGVYLEQGPSCPLSDVVLEAHYECTVAIVNGGTAYRDVTLGYDIPSTTIVKELAIPMLAANGEVKEAIPVVYGKDPVGDEQLSTEAIFLGVSYGTGFIKPTLFHAKYGVSLAPNCGPVAYYFGVPQYECR